MKILVCRIWVSSVCISCEILLKWTKHQPSRGNYALSVCSSVETRYIKRHITCVVRYYNWVISPGLARYVLLHKIRWLRNYISKIENFFEDIITSYFLSTAELGDYQPDVHDPDLVSEFLFYPNQDERMELNIFERFKELR